MSLCSFFIFLFIFVIPCFGENPNMEELRWNIPQDMWLKKSHFLLKGKYFRVVIHQSTGNEFEMIAESFDIFKDSSLKGKSVFKVTNGSIYKNDEIVCSRQYIGNIEKTKNPLVCGYGYCEPLLGDETIEVKPYEALRYGLGKDHQSCPFDIRFVVSTYERGYPNERDLYSIVYPTILFNFEYKAISEDKKSLEILINGEKYYLDIRLCNKYPKNCEFVNYKTSFYEDALTNLKHHQQNKDLPLMNILISDLLPCVKKKDTKCIEKYFVTEPDDEILELGSYFKYPKKIEVTEEMITELEACLDYKSVLPHLFGARGVKKVCIFQHRANFALTSNASKTLTGIKLLGLAYPEAVRKTPMFEKVYVKP